MVTPNDNITYAFWYINSNLVCVQPFPHCIGYNKIPDLIPIKKNNNDIYLYKNSILILHYRINYEENKIRTEIRYE